MPTATVTGNSQFLQQQLHAFAEREPVGASISHGQIRCWLMWCFKSPPKNRQRKHENHAPELLLLLFRLLLLLLPSFSSCAQ